MACVMDTPGLLQRLWGMRGADVQPLGGGMNSETWLIRHQGSTYVAKRVCPTSASELAAGCDIAALLAEAGLVTGRPVPTLDGRLVVTEHALAVLEHVPGRELEGQTDEEQRWIANTLADVHVAGCPERASSAASFAVDWLSPNLPGVEAHPWLAQAMEAVRADTDALTLTWSVLHTIRRPRRSSTTTAPDSQA